MSDIVQFKTKGFQEAVTKLRAVQNPDKKVKLAFQDFLEEFKTYIDRNWRTAGSPFGVPNKTLTAAYKKWKTKQGKANWADLQLTGKLRAAATGGDGWFQKISGFRLEYGISRSKIPYAMVHQYGYKRQTASKKSYSYKAGSKKGSTYESTTFRKGWPQRPYFALKDGSMPGALYERFRQIILFHTQIGE